jgi:3-hydroxyisobutyrate dehydrogenase
MTRSTAAPTRVAFLGLGRMGLPMARNLTASGIEVVGYDPVPEARAAAEEAGLTVADSAAAAVWEVGAVVTMLPNGRLLHEVYGDLGDEGVLDAASSGTLFVDCSTVSVEDARLAALRAIRTGHRAVDAPVSGGVGGAEAGTLTFMVGCDDRDLAAVTALLKPMAGRVVHCGSSGAGQAAKICNNMLLGVSMIAVSEAFVLAERLGLSHEALYEVSSVSSGQCWSLTTNCPVPGPVPTSPANRGYQPGFATELMVKDLGLAQDAARSSGTTTALGTHAAELFERFVAAGGRGLDFSAIVNDIRACQTDRQEQPA